jgi:hypothetical protein
MAGWYPSDERLTPGRGHLFGDAPSATLLACCLEHQPPHPQRERLLCRLTTDVGLGRVNQVPQGQHPADARL